MALYGSVDAVKAMLRADVGSVFNADQEARIVALRAAVSALIETETGRTFGVPTIETVAIRPGDRVGSTLLLPKALRSATTVTLDPTSTGTAWTGGTALALSAVEQGMVTSKGEALALVLTNGGTWPALVTVTGSWADTDGDTGVPTEITYIANYLIAERFKMEQASPAGQIGPDGSVIPVRNALRDPMVAAVLMDWRAPGPELVL